MFAYCMYCQTQRAKKIADLLLSQGYDCAFTPRVICHHWVQGRIIERPYDLLPGYVFLFTEEPILDFSTFRRKEGVSRILGRPDDRYELTGADRTFALQLYETDGLISPMPLVHEGTRVRLLNPLFENHHGTVTRVDYKKQRARVEFLFDEERWMTWVAIEELRL